MIEAENLTKLYGDLKAVDNLNLKTENEIFGFLGPNGAGKTTTIKMMTGLLKPTSGKVRICGYDIEKDPLNAKKMLSLVPDTPILYEKLTPVEFLHFIAQIYGMDKNRIKKRIEDLIEMFELKDRANKLIETFSHGMKQKCALASALIHEPQVIFLDEPTVGLDPKSAKMIKDILRQLADRGVAVFMSTHILEIAQNICDRIGIINKGKLIAQGTIEELRTISEKGEKNLEEIFLELTGGTEYKEVLKYLE